jgi:hypothetical protein
MSYDATSWARGVCHCLSISGELGRPAHSFFGPIEIAHFGPLFERKESKIHPNVMVAEMDNEIDGL